MSSAWIYVALGLALFLAVVLPPLLDRFRINAPIVLVTLGLLLGLLPGFRDLDLDPVGHGEAVLHITEFTVLVSLMGVGLALDRPLSFRDLGSWRSWSPTWRLLGVAMPLCIAGVGLLAWGAFGVAAPAALLLGAALAPTDPVLGLEHDHRASRRGQLPGRPQAGQAGADDDHVGVHGGSPRTGGGTLRPGSAVSCGATSVVPA